MKSDRFGWFMVFLLVLIPLMDSFIFELPYVWSTGGGYSSDVSINYLHAMNRKMNIAFAFIIAILFAMASDMASKNKGE